MNKDVLSRIRNSLLYQREREREKINGNCVSIYPLISFNTINITFIHENIALNGYKMRMNKDLRKNIVQFYN